MLLRSPKPLVLIPKTNGPIQYASRDVLEASQNRICFEHSRLPMLSPPISPRQFGGASQSSVWTKQKSRKLHFGTFEPLSYYRSYTFLAKGHSHSKCPAVSGCQQQRSHCGSVVEPRIYFWRVIYKNLCV